MQAGGFAECPLFTVHCLQTRPVPTAPHSTRGGTHPPRRAQRPPTHLACSRLGLLAGLAVNCESINRLPNQQGERVVAFRAAAALGGPRRLG